MIYTELVQQYGLEIADVYRVFHHGVRKLVGLAVDDTALDAATGREDGDKAQSCVCHVHASTEKPGQLRSPGRRCIFRPPLARFHSNNSQIVQDISALVHALRPTFVMQFRPFYN